MNQFTYRNWQRFLFLLTLCVFLFAFYFQYMQHLQPCPLCLMQRLCAFLFGLGCLATLRFPTLKWAKRISISQMLFAALGIFFAARQLWLQSLPPGQAPACLPPIDIMIHYFPLKDVLQTLLWGAGNCAEVTWKGLGLSMAAWSAVYFSICFVVSDVVFFRIRQSRNNF